MMREPSLRAASCCKVDVVNGDHRRSAGERSAHGAQDDHRSYNRDGSAFDVGETFSGVDYATGVSAAQEFSALVAMFIGIPVVALVAGGQP